uniref:flagellar export protein FliJ n=1 Tax=Thaumasiovibrio occultus TaxID=1891184 RepID=UPI000B359739|nr:flagellar export protein FliJ [Thaumasiovibrio occultus]
MADNAMALLLERAEQDEHNALLAVEQARQELENYHQQLAQIEQYRLDYFRQMTERGQAGLTASEYGHLHRFINQLDETLSKQKLAGEHFEQQQHDCQAAFIEARKRRRSIEWMLDKRQSERDKAQAKREQKQMDEFSSLLYARRLSAQNAR